MEGSRFPLFALAFLSIISAGAFAALLFSVDPAYASAKTRGIFYCTFFAMTAGIAAWVFLLAYGRFARVRRPLAYFFHDALRQGLLVSVLLTASLLLQANHRLSLLVAFGLVAFIFLLEGLVNRSAWFRS